MHPHNEKSTFRGRVEHVFAHRFTVKSETATILADLTPHGARHVVLKAGDEVLLKGEQKPSELKVETITLGDHTYILPPGPSPHHGPGSSHGKPHDHHPKHHHDVVSDDDAAAMKALLRKAGYEPVGDARPRHRHAEWLVRKDGQWLEAHVTFEGEIRKVKDADLDSKWAGRAA